MVWLNWRGALVIVSAWVALACGQAFTQSGAAAPTTGKAERILTLYENGKALRCRVVGTWRDAEGKTAHQLQSLDSGELITIVESGVAAPANAEGRRAIRTRNFHWGLAKRTPPTGCPMPPSHIMSACSSGPGVINTVSHQPPKDALVHAGPSIVVNSKVLSERTNWWEEKDGKRISPIITTDGKNPFETDPSLPSMTVASPPGGRDIVCPPTTGVDKPCEVVAKPTPPTPKELPVPTPFKPKAFTTAAEPTLPLKIEPKAPTEDKPKKDWRTMWGQGSDATMDPPGKSLMPAAVKPGAGPQGGLKTADSKDDVLRNPDKLLPTGRTPITELPLTAPPDGPGTVLSGVTGMPGSVPYGAQSVIAAKNGLVGPVTYIPVPMTTIPEPIRPPTPPPPRMPEAPQPTAFVNAFTPPPAPMAKTPPMNPQGMMPAGGMHAGMTPPGMMHPGMRPGMSPGMHPGMAHPGMMPTHPGMPYPPMTQPAMRPGMNPAMMNPAAHATPMNPYNYPRQYAGPTPPNPFAALPAQPVVPASHVAPTGAAEVGKILTVLRDSLYPAQREWAANQLANHDWRTQPEILPALMLAGKSDPAATVRASCVNALARMNAQTQPVVDTIHALRGDTDPRVRQEAENALVRMGMKR